MSAQSNGRKVKRPNRPVKLQTNLTPQEADAVTDAANRQGVSVASYIRVQILKDLEV